MITFLNNVINKKFNNSAEKYNYLQSYERRWGGGFRTFLGFRILRIGNRITFFVEEQFQSLAEIRYHFGEQ